MNPYTILGIAPTATPEEIKAAYWRRIRIAHPDCGGSSEIAASINAARDVAIARKGWKSTASAPEVGFFEVCGPEKFTPEHTQPASAAVLAPTLSTSPPRGVSASLTGSQWLLGIVAGYLGILAFAVLGWIVSFALGL
jgi:hypothetical protein